jgi:hypothetical protein
MHGSTFIAPITRATMATPTCYASALTGRQASNARRPGRSRRVCRCRSVEDGGDLVSSGEQQLEVRLAAALAVRLGREADRAERIQRDHART